MASVGYWKNPFHGALYIVASHLTWGSVITVAVGHTNGGLGDCGLPTLQGAYETSFNNYSLT